MAKLAVGSLNSFNHEVQEWSLYKDRLEQWFEANEIETSEKVGIKRRAILLSNLAENTYKLVRDLALPSSVGSLDYDSVVKLLDSHFKVKKCGFAERNKFHGALQQPNESLASWAARVRGLAIDCGFLAAVLDEELRDRFVLGMTPGPERDQLFTKELTELTLSKALEIAEGVRSARLGAQQSAPGGVQSNSSSVMQQHEIFKMASSNLEGAVSRHGEHSYRAGGGAPGSRVPGGSVAARCTVCGYTGHKAAMCRFSQYKCKKCGVKGHLKRMCYKKKQHFIECRHGC